MDNKNIREIFEAYFEKYKKTEGDMTVWSAYWVVYATGHSFEINMTKQEFDIRFRIFADKQKIDEVFGWDIFLQKLDELELQQDYIFTKDDFFGQMAEML